MDEVAAMQAYSHLELSYLETSGITFAGEDNDHSQGIMLNVHDSGLASRKQNGSIDASVSASASDSTMSHGSLDISQANGFSKNSPIPDPRIVKIQRNKSLTKEGIEAYWRSRKKAEEEHLSAVSDTLMKSS